MKVAGKHYLMSCRRSSLAERTTDVSGLMKQDRPATSETLSAVVEEPKSNKEIHQIKEFSAIIDE